MRLIARAGNIGFFEWNTSKDGAYWSPEHYDLFGYEVGSPITWERWLQGVHPDDRLQVMQNASRLLERGRTEGGVQGHKDEYRVVRPDGSVVWLGIRRVGGDGGRRGNRARFDTRCHPSQAGR